MIKKEDFIELPVLLYTYNAKESGDFDEDSNQPLTEIEKVEIPISQFFNKNRIASYRAGVDKNLKLSEEFCIIQLADVDVYINMNVKIFEKVLFGDN